MQKKAISNVLSHIKWERKNNKVNDSPQKTHLQPLQNEHVNQLHAKLLVLLVNNYRLQKWPQFSTLSFSLPLCNDALLLPLREVTFPTLNYLEYGLVCDLLWPTGCGSKSAVSERRPPMGKTKIIIIFVLNITFRILWVVKIYVSKCSWVRGDRI